MQRGQKFAYDKIYVKERHAKIIQNQVIHVPITGIVLTQYYVVKVTRKTNISWAKDRRLCFCFIK